MLPITDFLRCRIPPIVTVVIVVLNVLAFMWEQSMISNGNQEMINLFSLVPGNVTHAFVSADPALIGFNVLTFFTSIFLHQNLEHIGFNMVFFFAFGRSLEARLGHKRFLLFYLAAGIAAGLGQWVMDPLSAGSVIGASGAIAGVLGGYLAIWWWQDILVLHPASLFVPGTVKSCFVLVYWFVVQQLFPVYQQYMHFSASADHTAYGEHIGGFVLGFTVAFLIWLKEPTSETCYNPSDCSPCDPKDEFQEGE